MVLTVGDLERGGACPEVPPMAGDANPAVVDDITGGPGRAGGAYLVGERGYTWAVKEFSKEI